MVRAAVHEPDPSFDGRFIVPLQASYTRDEVARELLPYLTNGTLDEQIGAANAYYHVYGLGPPQNDMARKVWSRFLRLFIKNDNLELRRFLVPFLAPTDSWYEEDDRQLLRQYVDIASTSDDAYIKNRWQIHTVRSDRSAIIPVMRKPPRP